MEQYDFYFSASLKRDLMRHNKYVASFVNGREYTEMIKRGRTPMTFWRSDLIKIETDDNYIITYGTK